MHTKFSWLQEGKNIHAQSWRVDTPVAIVCLIHGMGEHSSRYMHVKDFFNLNGISMYTFDHIGHGLSDGKRGHTPNYNFLLESIEKILTIAIRENMGLPIFLYGHSMGGNVVANYLIRRTPEIAGAILSAPWFTLPFKPPTFKITLAKFMNIIYSSFSDITNLDANAISRDKNVVEAYQKDSLVHNKITPSFFLSCFEAGKWARDRGEAVRIPTLVLHGTKDRLTSYTSSKEFALSNTLIHFKSYEGLYHELHNEPEKNIVLNDILDFIHTMIHKK